ncbi:hypothetical protein [Phyllobacterium endophyticum]|jgi:hypothetical protein|uniref:Uncharacterized protein n=1 Tax=Phyllobacterium endophyticum TaxID=1149773 RepID=A0A2P7ANX1_9HYPH|nr:hypothetical protein [Phyllobacterium endophyticum]MBB3233761.1 hypothetical protein [Phyllobacterium endophyticum]PSH55897.1 hypothetical protein CU100_19840 [Phyllobacterium endophyticum]TXR47249.1 hypothetical protein FVA77_21135 [Phyllobacterium endophyticum]TYR41039.1 hypothetical protein FY050_06855 [Phyllobacterium endophyticum]
MPIKLPKLPYDHPDRDVACEEAMQMRFNELYNTPNFFKLSAEAMDAGWEPEEVRLGIRHLIAARTLLELGIGSVPPA